MMNLIHNSLPIRVGVLTDEPLRLEGLSGIFEDRPGEGYSSLSPIFGNIEELLSDTTLAYLVIDLNCPSGSVETLEAIRHRRPDLRLIVIGPEGDDNQIMDLIMAGARAYLDLKAGPRIVRQAVEVVTSGSIWAPRRLLSLLIDRLLESSDTSLTAAPPHLTDREQQVLELILTASSNREIASQLGIEQRTVQAHVGRLMRKMGADNRTELSMRALNPALISAVGADKRHQNDRRQGDRRQNDRRQGISYAPKTVTHE
jgi:DNA-binding NarL/FixJ family response regulator